MTRQSTVFGGGGVPAWEYLLLDSTVQLVNGDAKAVDLAATGYWYTRPSGPIVANNILEIGFSQPENSGLTYWEDDYGKKYSGDFVFEIQIGDIGVNLPGRGLQISDGIAGGAPELAVLTVTGDGANTVKIEGTSVTDTSVSDSSGLIRVEAVGSALNIYANNVLVATGTRPAINLYLLLWVSSGNFASDTFIEALQPVTAATTKLLLPATTTGGSSSVNVRDFTGEASVGNPIIVEATAAVIFGEATYDIAQAKGSFNFISPTGTVDWMIDDLTGNWGGADWTRDLRQTMDAPTDSQGE